MTAYWTMSCPRSGGTGTDADLAALVNCDPFSNKAVEKSSRPLNWASEKSAIDRNVARRKSASPSNWVKVKNA